MSYVYFIDCVGTGAMKIGFTTRSPQQRMREIDATGTPGNLRLALTMIGTRDDEIRLHDKFAHLRIRRDREWFKYSDEMSNFVLSRSLERAEPWAADDRMSLTDAARYCGYVDLKTWHPLGTPASDFWRLGYIDRHMHDLWRAWRDQPECDEVVA